MGKTGVAQVWLRCGAPHLSAKTQVWLTYVLSHFVNLPSASAVKGLIDAPRGVAKQLRQAPHLAASVGNCS